ncbi:MAG: hypothetical protein KDD02_04435 [Phaeodactylibacter sp.]|nr:hypothetical protein [Phaeodactylibacter sp.]MCB9301442.1 hypothetical protein [Lewinellaceae bacterium]
MRKLILLSLLTLAFSCNNVGKFQEAINTLSSDWDAATAQVTDVVGKISQSQELGKTALQTVNPDEMAMAKMNDEQKAKVESIKQSLQEQIGSLGQLAQSAFEFVNKWQTEGEKLTALKEGLANKKLPKDVQATIDSLKSMADTATQNASSWNEQVASATAAINQASQSYNDLMSSIPMSK